MKGENRKLLNTGTAGGGKSPPPANRLIRWAVLLLAFLILSGFVHLSPNLERLPMVGTAIENLRESGIDTGAWYYDDVEEVQEARKIMRNLRQ